MSVTPLPLSKKPRLKTVQNGLSAVHISKSYKKRPVLRDVSLDIQRGEAVALLGPNGAGKTTCFHIILHIGNCANQILTSGSHLILGLQSSSFPCDDVSWKTACDASNENRSCTDVQQHRHDYT